MTIREGREGLRMGGPDQRLHFHKFPARVYINSREVPVPCKVDLTKRQTIWKVILYVYRGDNTFELLPYRPYMFAADVEPADLGAC